MAIIQQGDQRKTVVLNRPASTETAGFSASFAERFVLDLQAASAGQTALPGLLKNLAACIRKHAPCLGLWYVNCKPDGTIDRAHSLLGTADDAEGHLLWQTFQPQFLSLANSVLAQQALASQTINGHPGLSAVAQPVFQREAGCLLFGLFDDSAANNSQRKSRSPVDYQWMIAHAVGRVEAWESARRVNLLEANTNSFADSANLNQALDASQNRFEACMTLVNVVRKITQSSQVAMALCETKKQTPKLVAVSDVEAFDRHNPACQAMTALLVRAVKNDPGPGSTQGSRVRQNAGLSGTSESDQRLENTPPDGNRSHDEVSLDREEADYCDAVSCEACVAFRLKDSQGQTFGALLMGGMKTTLHDEARLSKLKQLVAFSGGHLAVVLKSHRHPAQIAKHAVDNILRKRGTKIAAACALLLCGILAVPWPTKVACNSEMQPVLRRFVAAPHDGILEAALVESGEVVRQGQLLARLDGRQTRMELASRNAELNSQRKQRDSALAVRDVAKSQIASLEMRRLQAEIELLNQRLANLEISSPIDGVVLNGDLEKVEGAPLSMGQNLFEISPLDELLAEVAIPEAEIQYVQEQMPVAVKLDAFPFQKWSGTIEKIHPRAEIVDDQSVFIAEVRMANDNGLIKPGMKGKASIRGERYPLAWALVRRPWEQIRGWLVW